MSRSLVQPIGQKRLTNVAVVRLKKMGMRFEIACYKNKVLSWRSGVEKDLDEVLQSHTVYSNVSKGILAKSKDLLSAFSTLDQSNICLQILDKGELQVAGKERESQLSNRFRDIATIVMHKTVNPDTQRPYTITMIERLMHEIHFAVDPNTTSKKQALEVIRELQKNFPIKRSPMRLRVIVPAAECDLTALMERLKSWDANIVSKVESRDPQTCVIFELDPGFFRDCNALVRGLEGRLEVLAVSVHAEGDAHVETYEGYEEFIPKPKTSDAVAQVTDELERQTISGGSSSVSGEAQQTKQSKCSTCDAFVGNAKEYREHFKSDWHKHNLKRKMKSLPPLSLEECSTDLEVGDTKADLREYSF